MVWTKLTTRRLREADFLRLFVALKSAPRSILTALGVVATKKY
jgi:hypothetical protein